MFTTCSPSIKALKLIHERSGCVITRNVTRCCQRKWIRNHEKKSHHSNNDVVTITRLKNKNATYLCCPWRNKSSFFINHYDLPDDLEEQDPNYRGDVNTGGVYRKLRDEGLVTKNTITVQLNLDGAACFKVIISQLISSKHFNYATKLNCIFFYLLGQLIFILAFNGPYK